jgi:serine/threonine-protein kinase
LLEGKLPSHEQVKLTGHIDTCVDCQHTLEGLAAGSMAWPDAAPMLGRETVPPEPALRRVMAELKREPSEAETTTGTGEAGAIPLDFLSPPQEPGHIGRLGPYEITEVIGRGGMGIVLKGFDEALHREVAIKIMAPHLAADDTARHRFLREARSAAAVIHPHVVTIHAVGEHQGLPYLVMEYVPGISLQERLNRGGPLDLRDIVRIGAETAGGLAAAHARGLIHRDIKPANLLLAPAGPDRWTIKITDFGLARASGISGVSSEGVVAAAPDYRAPDLSREGVLAGTPDYMAPEQARGQTLDHRADLFALGSVLYTLCTGQVPFPADTHLAVLYRVCEEVPRSIREINSAIPDWLARIVHKLQAKDPADRFQSAAEVADLFGLYSATLDAPSRMLPHLRQLVGFEYRSRRTLWGLPLVHVATGWDPETGRKRIARGIIAVGEIAVGLVAVGGVTCGGLAIGGGACGAMAMGGGALGLVAIGGVAIGILLAFGGLAIGLVAVGGVAIGYYAYGGWVTGVHALSNTVRDPEAIEFFGRWFRITD